MPINLIAWRVRNHHNEIKKLIMRTCLYNLLLIILSIIIKLILELHIQTLQLHTTNINQKINQVTPASKLRQPITTLHSLVFLRKNQVRLRRENQSILMLLLNISDLTPKNIMISKILINPPTILITGVSHDLASIHDYASSLQKEYPEQIISLTQIKSNLTRSTRFLFSINITKWHA